MKRRKKKIEKKEKEKKTSQEKYEFEYNYQETESNIEDDEFELKKDYNKKNPFVKVFIFFAFFICLTLIYARFLGTKGFTVKEYDIKDSGIPESFDGFTIVHFSDLDLGSTFFIDSFDKVVKEINKLNPDIVVFTGDMFFSSDKKTKEQLIHDLKKIDPLIGKYLVRGDKDVKNADFDEIVSESGFIDLTNQGKLIYYKGITPIGIYGIDSLNKGKPSFNKSLKGVNANYKILLAHEPDSLDEAKDLDFNLMLAGHSHNNEINIPLIKKVLSLDGAKKYYNEKYHVLNTNLYISSGLGTEKTFMRLFNKPSINCYTFVA